MMIKKCKALLTAGLAAAMLSCAGAGALTQTAKAAENDVWLPGYTEADAAIDAKDHNWWDEETSAANELCEFYTTNAVHKTTDWSGRVPSFDAEGSLVSYYGGATIGAHTPEASVGSAATVAENTTKLKIARSLGQAGYRYIYPVQLDGLTVTLNFQQVAEGDRLRFSFGESYDTIANTFWGAEQNCRGLVVELHQESAAWVQNNWLGINLRSAEKFADDTGATGNPASDWFSCDGADPGGKTVKMTFAVNEDDSVTLAAQSHRNHEQDTCPTKTYTIPAEKVTSLGMIGADGNTWINVNSHADANGTGAYTRFAVKVEDAQRTAYETGDLAAFRAALDAYGTTAIANGVVTGENRHDWQEKRKAVTDLVSKIRVSDLYLLDVEAHLEAADAALAEKLSTGVETQIRAQIEEYKNAPLTTLDEIYAALAKKEAIGDFSAFEDKEALEADVAAKDAALIAAADGLLQERMAEIDVFAQNGVKSYQQSLRAQELKDSVTDRDLLKGQALTLEKAAEYEAAIASMTANKKTFDDLMESEKLYLTNQHGKAETSVNDVSFVEKGMQYVFTGGGRQLGLNRALDIERGARAVLSVNEWAYLSNVYNPNSICFFVSPRANSTRGAGSLAGMLFIYEDSVMLQTFYGKSNNYVDIVNIEPIAAGDDSYIAFEIKLNKDKSRYEITLEYLDKDGNLIDFASSYMAYKTADDDIGAVDIDADTYEKGAYFYMNSWMTLENFKDENGTPDPALTPEKLFNTVTFKVFGDRAYDEAFAVDYIASVAVKEGSMKAEYKVGDTIDLTGAKLVVTKESGATEEVEIKRSMISGFTTKNEGRVTLEIAYEGFKTSFEINVVKASGGDSASDSVSDASSPAGGGCKSSGCKSSFAGAGTAAAALGIAALAMLKKRREK